MRRRRRPDNEPTLATDPAPSPPAPGLAGPSPTPPASAAPPDFGLVLGQELIRPHDAIPDDPMTDRPAGAEPRSQDGGPVEVLDDPPTAPIHSATIDVRDETVLDPGPLADLDFWAMYDEARAVADLLDVPPTSTVAVVGPLEVAMPAARRCRSRHWINDDDVFVLTDRPDFVDEPSWNVIHDERALVNVLEGASYPSAMLVIDVPGELPRSLRALVERLREAGLALVRYVLDGDPSNEDLATWHGELGRPSALDLAGTVKPARVLELLDRAEPVASIAGVPITPELILALRMDVLDH
ncbi:MAG: hypothetical protein AAGK32_16310 [Actinomycetota bacterium]